MQNLGPVMPSTVDLAPSDLVEDVTGIKFVTKRIRALVGSNAGTDGRVEDDDVATRDVPVPGGPAVDEDPVGAKAFVLVDRRPHGAAIHRRRITYRMRPT